MEIPLEEWKDVIGRNSDRVKMVKSAAITRLGFTPVAAAQQISEATGVPIYMHVGDIGDFGNQPKHMTIITREVIDMLRPGDIVTHVYTGNWGNLLDDRGTVYPEVMAAKKRGVLFDVGFGGLNFGFDAYDRLLNQGVVTDVISSDLQGVNITGPAHSLAHVMSLFMNFGMTLKDVVERVTINPAKAQGLDHMIGSLTPGYPARITVFGVEEGSYTFRDCEGGKRTGSQMIVPEPLRDGRRADRVRHGGGDGAGELVVHAGAGRHRAQRRRPRRRAARVRPRAGVRLPKRELGRRQGPAQRVQGARWRLRHR